MHSGTLLTLILQTTRSRPLCLDCPCPSHPAQTYSQKWVFCYHTGPSASALPCSSQGSHHQHWVTFPHFQRTVSYLSSWQRCWIQLASCIHLVCLDLICSFITPSDSWTSPLCPSACGTQGRAQREAAPRHNVGNSHCHAVVCSSSSSGILFFLFSFITTVELQNCREQIISN